MSDQIKVLVVDDSALFRKVIIDILESDPQIKVIGTANNGKTAIYRNNELNPDVITLDIEMPLLDGLSALETIMSNNPKPVIMLSSLTRHGAEATFKALDLGAIDFVPKPSSSISLTVDDIKEILILKVKSVYNLKFAIAKREFKSSKTNDPDAIPKTVAKKELVVMSHSTKIIGIGTSTGGPSALINVFNEFPDNFPSPVLVVQHMPEGFTKAFAERLDNSSRLNVKEGEDNDELLPGNAYIAPGHSHMFLEKSQNKFKIRLKKGEKISGHMPSIDTMFDSLAENVGRDTIGVIMTGMGKDGADGINKIKKQGGYTIAQDENSSIVFGMNRVAVENGGIIDVVSLSNIAKKIVEHI